MPCALATRTPKYSIFARTRGSSSDFNSRSTAAFVQRGLSSAATKCCLEGVVRIEEDGDWAFINQLHGHHGLKNSSGDGNTQLAQRFAKFLIKRFCEFRRGRGDEAGPALAARIPIQRELRNSKRAAFHIKQRAVHLTRIVFKDAEVRASFCHSRYNRRSVVAAHTEQNHQPRPNFSGDAAVYGHFRAAGPLKDGAHAGFSDRPP